MNRFAKTAVILIGLSTAGCAAGAILLGAYDIGFETVLLAVPALVLHSKLKKAERSGGKVSAGDSLGALIIAGITLTITFLTPPFMSSHGAWRYPMQRAYIGLFKNVHVPDEFPDRFEDVLDGYNMQYVPALMQGNGIFRAEFRTTPERAAAFAEKYAPMAIHTVSLDDYIANGFTADGFDPSSVNDGSVLISVAESIENGHSPSAVIYVLYTNYNRHHPRAAAVIVDGETGRVQFSREG